MSWRRVALVVSFAAVITLVGRSRMSLLVLPGDLAASLVPVIRSVRADISMRIWVWWFANMWTWAMVGELLCLLWAQRHHRRATHAAHA